MRIAVLGAAGSTGSRVAIEALSRGHEVTGVTRSAAALPAGVRSIVGDAADPAEIKRLSVHDVVIASTRPRPGREAELARAASAMLTGLAGTQVRVLAVGGAATSRFRAVVA